MTKYAEVEPLDKALNGYKCVYCNSDNTAWTDIDQCEVGFHCSQCGEGFRIEICFLSDEAQEVIFL